MTDREYLELAAKAAGLLEMAVGDKDIQKYLSRWNPLTDDGDALRLAVKLGIGVYWAAVYVHAPKPSGESCHEFREPDPYAATRRAIVRAAAEIGRTL